MNISAIGRPLLRREDSAQRNRRNALALSFVLGLMLAWACAPGDLLPSASAQSSGCAQWEVAVLAGPELGESVDTIEVESIVRYPSGWEPFSGTVGGIAVRHCAD